MAITFFTSPKQLDPTLNKTIGPVFSEVDQNCKPTVDFFPLMFDRRGLNISVFVPNVNCSLLNLNVQWQIYHACLRNLQFYNKYNT